MKKLLASRLAFRLFNIIIGADQSRKCLIRDYIKPLNAERVLDIGCGTAEILKFLPSVDYHGFDISTPYINKARQQYSTRAMFHNKKFTVDDAASIGQFDIVLCLGLLHHLPDDECIELLRLISTVLKPGGRLLTIDGGYLPYQSRIARYILDNDRGKYVRTEDGYTKIVGAVFEIFNISIRHDMLRVPYTHIIYECRQPKKNLTNFTKSCTNVS